MKFSTKIPHEKDEINQKLREENFQQVKEPNTVGKAIIISIPIMIILFFATYGLMAIYSPIELIDLGIDLMNNEIRFIIPILPVHANSRQSISLIKDFKIRRPIYV